MVAAFRVIGQSVVRGEGADKVTGRARYTADVQLPGTVWGKTLHSSHSHARIVSIDTSAARALPGVFAVITGEDVGEKLYGSGLKDHPVLAKGRVRYAGERVAAVAAVDEDTAQRAIDLIEVEYEELPAVFDVGEASVAGAPLLHPDFNDYVGVHRERPRGVRGLDALAEPSNVYHRTRHDVGDVDAGFAAADVVVERTYHTSRMHQGFLEPQNVLVQINDDGSVDAWAGSKVPYRTRGALSHAAGLPEEQVTLHHAYIGGDFGGKGTPILLPICYFLAKASGRPVRMVNDYLEEFLAGNPRHAVAVRLRTGVMKDGALVAHHVQYVSNAGAYACFTPFGTTFGPTQSAGPYRVPNVRLESAFVYTNTVPAGFMRAPGEVQAFFALESQIDEVARAVNMDPVEFRLKNLVDEGEEPASGEPLEAVRVKETLRAAAAAAGYYDAKAPNVGRGVAISERPPGAGEGNSSVTLRPDGTVLVGTPIFDQGTGTYTTIRQVVAEELQLPIERVEVGVWSTGVVASDSGVAGSWATRINSGAAYEAAQAAKTELMRYIAEHQGWNEDSLSLRGDEVWSSEAEDGIAWPDLLASNGDEVSAQAHYDATSRSKVTSFCVQVAEVEVDRETGELKIRNLISAHDTGRIINPIGHDGQINGAVIQGLGYALMEELRVEDGRVTNLSFGDYKLPTIADIPPLKTVVLESDSGVGPYAIKGIGESPVGPTAPAIANAIRDAVGVRIYDLPLTAEKVYEALKATNGR